MIGEFFPIIRSDGIDMLYPIQQLCDRLSHQFSTFMTDGAQQSEKQCK